MDNKNNLRVDDLPDIITAEEISNVLRISYAGALKMIKFGKLRHIKINKNYRVTKKDFLEWLYNKKDIIIEFE